jgi:hypothetical protein
MVSPTLLSEHGLRIAVEGCGHGVLHEIYASVAKSCELASWPGVDLLIIGGDFQVCLQLDRLISYANSSGRPQCLRPESGIYA